MSPIRQAIIIIDRQTDTAIAHIPVHLPPHPDQIARYRAAAVTLTGWAEAHDYTFNQLDWCWRGDLKLPPS